MRITSTLDVKTLVASLAAALTIITIGCSDSGTTPSPAAHKLHGEVLDPTGDMLVDPRLPRSPDLTYATVDVTKGEVTIVVGFAPGTFDRESMGADVFLDVDQNPSTGTPSREGIFAGVDFLITLDVRQSAGSAGQLSAYSPLNCDQLFLRCFRSLGRLNVTATENALQTVVPLSMLNGSDGHATFQVQSFAVLPDTTFDTDLMPNANLPAARVQ